ncbi:hypothetical protein JW921_05885 [Candidatus Fermentibacterales bacterium]|nr:hypothetical protein [Candidatus Fermentibacterales bacterium]
MSTVFITLTTREPTELFVLEEAVGVFCEALRQHGKQLVEPLYELGPADRMHVHLVYRDWVFLSRKELQNLWPWGFLNIARARDECHVAAYLMKYPNLR